ncbi:hypothetical protein ADIS_3965 [Lunatimonas lonarensis]|uniref:Uncharacterized protein n=1 Tax=Lunatimonas lonarensis TaxID=1232681 RepID=R7ZNA5_9BACT|nr:hypothetical protein [Lunatimonas lonarensis]EON75562.1 hypothetical protein ADIS_3965 [Lunatimonas lonarensis]
MSSCMKKLGFVYFLVAYCTVACTSSEENREVGPATKLTLELVDSLVVDELNTLVIDDYSPETGYFLLRALRSRKPYLVDEKGTILQVFDVLDDGPNGLGANGAFGYRLLGRDRWVAEVVFNGYHVYDLAGKKLTHLPSLQKGMFGMSVYHYQTNFHPYVKGGKAYLVGKESNLVNPVELNPKEIGAAYYDSANILFRYSLADSTHQLLETYPKGWTPRIEGSFVGSGVIMAFHPGKQEMAVLPVKGNQLFVYDFSGEEPILRDTVELFHKDRPLQVPVVKFSEEDQFSDYPSFFDLRYAGDDLVAVFSTKIPTDVMRQLRAGSEQYYNTPEYKEAMALYSKMRWIWVSGGKQIGVLDEFPRPGHLDFADVNGHVYLNDNADPEVERSYNVFYKFRLKR